MPSRIYPWNLAINDPSPMTLPHIHEFYIFSAIYQALNRPPRRYYRVRMLFPLRVINHQSDRAWNLFRSYSASHWSKKFITLLLRHPALRGILVLSLKCLSIVPRTNIPQGRMGRKRSSVDLGINYPGDLLVKERQKKQLIKRNTIADFAATKTFQASTQSLISEQGKCHRHDRWRLRYAYTCTK